MSELEYQTEPANLQVISCQSLLGGDLEAISRLYSAAVQDGFFYLDLTEQATFNVLDDQSSLTDTAEKLFKLPMEEKLKYDTNKLGNLKNYGYKPMGRNTGVVEGKNDGHELYLIPRDVLLHSLLGGDSLAGPKVLLDEMALIQRFVAECHQICTLILSCLSQCLSPQGVAGLEQQHRPNYSSTSALALLKYPRQESSSSGGHIAHTDVGTLTLLFCGQKGLQIFQPTTSQWANVEPRANHAVVNIGDSLRLLSGYALRSALHRVLPCTSIPEDARYSIIYFMRPEKSAVMQDKDGKRWTSIDWHNRKFDAFRSADASKVTELLTGKV